MSQPNRTHPPTDYDLTCWYLNARRVIGLGKNGDQNDRPFSEPVDLFVLQNFHELPHEVR
jgi:hypothetical protein